MKTFYLALVFCFIGIGAFAQETQPESQSAAEQPRTEIAIPKDSTGTLVPENTPPQESKSFTLDANDATVERVNVQDSTPVVVATETVENNSATQNQHKTWNRNDEIQTLGGKNSHHGGFGAVSFRSGEFNDQSMIMLGFRAGWIINRAMGIGFEGYGLLSTSEYKNIDPNSLLNTRAVGGYGGIFLEPIVYSNKLVHVTFPIAGGAGWIGYLLDWEQNTGIYENDIVDDDIFWYLEPGAALELNVARNFRINLGATYRFTQDLELISTPSTGFDGWNYFLTLKFGRF